MGISRWYDEVPLRVLRRINKYRYGWLIIAAIILLFVAMIVLIYGSLAASG